jgi:hypothetical protein
MGFQGMLKHSFTLFAYLRSCERWRTEAGLQSSNGFQQYTTVLWSVPVLIKREPL